MITTLATVFLTFAFIVLFSKHARQSREFNAYRDNIQEQKKEQRVLDEVPHGTVRLDEKRNRLVGRVKDFTFVFTVDPRMQNMAEEALRRFGERHNMGSEEYTGAIVGLDASTGAVKVMASYESRRSAYFTAKPWSGLLDPLARNSSFPMASIQKIITAATALDTGVATPETVSSCDSMFHVDGRTIASWSPTSMGKMSLGQALATSCNTIFGRLALDISEKKLSSYYHKFMFNRRLEFDLPAAESVFTIASGQYELAEAGCGLAGARVSPLHAAMVAATMNNRGVMMKPFVVDSIERDGKVVRKTGTEVLSEPISKATAGKMAKLMEGTIEQGGTGYDGFGSPMQSQGLRRDVPSKTGSIDDACKAVHITWFVGHVADGPPDMAFAVLLTVRRGIRTHASYLAWDFFETVFHDRKIQKNER